MYRILVADKNHDDRKKICAALARVNINSDPARSFGEMKTKLEKFNYDLMIVESNFNQRKKEKLQFLELAKKNPTILVSNQDENLNDRIEAIKSGIAEAYLFKPLHVSELIAQVSAVIRRLDRVEKKNQKIQCGDVVLDSASMTSVFSGEVKFLNAKEFNLLRLLIQNKKMAVSRSEILEEVWQEKDNLSSNTIEVHISRLRDHLKKVNLKIETVRGVGYRIS